ncbi:DUF423 domain-containing protein [Escherichia coli]|nr:DUF423 domain-containing protein [Salmonella enterica subsp. enterica serovar Enteritidis]EFG9941197.1 DUF423 domain-containing protein [Escherichia coli]
MRFLIVIGALLGACGVGLSASAAHAGGAFTQTIANMLLFHAPLFVAFGLAGAERTGRYLPIAAGVLLAGLLLFSLDLYVRDLGADRLFPMAAPVGGGAMLIGWLAIAVTAVLKRN